MTAVSNLDDFQALDPYFRIIERGVAGLVDGEHFFDLLAEDVIVEYVITVPGYPDGSKAATPWPSCTASADSSARRSSPRSAWATTPPTPARATAQ